MLLAAAVWLGGCWWVMGMSKTDHQTGQMQDFIDEKISIQTIPEHGEAAERRSSRTDLIEIVTKSNAS
jgi:hypothetical protein